VAIVITAGVCVIGALVWILFLGELRQVDWAAVAQKRTAMLPVQT
jgi:hypothetical protein